MLRKVPRSGLLHSLKTTGKLILVVEVASLLGSYAIWHRLNTSRDFRFYMYQKFPSVLEGYYSFGEKLSGDNSIRIADYESWERAIGEK